MGVKFKLLNKPELVLNLFCSLDIVALSYNPTCSYSPLPNVCIDH